MKGRFIIKKGTTIERAFKKENLIGKNVDLYEVIYSYKVMHELSEDEIEQIYDELSERLGFNW